MIPLVDIKAQQQEIAEELMPALAEAFNASSFIGGEAVTRFEASYADVLSVKHCVGVANGTDALELALRAVGVEAGDEVIVPANTFIATAEAVARIGALPVLVDVDRQHLLIDPKQVRQAISARTRAIVPVHLFGQVAPVEELTDLADEFGLKLVEDAAQAHGALRHGQAAGGLGHIAATSFYPGKNLGAAGDAGAVTTNDESLAMKVRLMACHGSRAKYMHELMGMNSRLDAIQALVLETKLRRLAQWNQQRRAAADYYHELLGDAEGIDLPSTLEGNRAVWHLYVVQVEERDRILKHLETAGVQAGVHYPVPLHLTDAWLRAGYSAGSFPVAESASKHILSLPIYPHITRTQQQQVAVSLLDAVHKEGQ